MMLKARNTPVDNYRSPAELDVGWKATKISFTCKCKQLEDKKQLMMISPKKRKGKIRRNKASIMINTQRK